MTRIQLLASLALASLLAACGGNDDTNPPRGALLEAPTTVATMTTAQIDGATAQSGLQALTGTAKCDVKVVALNYNTIGPKGEQTNASAAMLVPVSSAT